MSLQNHHSPVFEGEIELFDADEVLQAPPREEPCDPESSDNELYDNSNESVGSYEDSEDDCTDDESETASLGKSQPVRSKNEIADLPRVELVDSEFSVHETQTEPTGTVHSVVEKMVIVQSHRSGSQVVLDEGTLLMICSKADPDKYIPLGPLFDTFGPVTRPLYSVRFNAPQEIASRAVCVGDLVYHASDTAVTVLMERLLEFRGCDASNIHDEEIPEEEQEFFSDDEKEQIAKSKGARKRKHSTRQDSVKTRGQNGEGAFKIMPPLNVLQHPARRGYPRGQRGRGMHHAPGVLGFYHSNSNANTDK